MIGFLAGMKYDNLLFLYDMGTGKTKLSLDLIRQRKRQGLLTRALVLVPTVIGVDSWVEQVGIHAPMLSVASMAGGREEREDVTSGRVSSTIVITTYMGWLSMVCDRDAKGKCWVINKARVKKLSKQFDMVVYDESTALKNHRSLSFRVARMMTKFIRFRYGLTGTPFGRNPQDLWGQFYVIDRGEALGETLGLFRAAVFSETEEYWGGYKYTFKKQCAQEVRRMMAHSALQYAADECGDLPPVSRIKRSIVWSDEAWDYYECMLAQLREARGNYQMLDNVWTRMRQLASGLLVVESDDGDRKEIRLANPKMDALIEWINELPRKEKVVIFNEFISSGNWLVEALSAEGIQTARLYSGIRDKKAELQRFNQDPKCRAFVVNTQSGAKVLNLQVARYIAFYESPTSPIDRRQAEKRCHREGQIRKVFYYDFFIRNSVEEKILVYLQEGKDLYQALVTGKVRV